MRVMLELLRIIIIIFIAGGLAWFLIGGIYKVNEVTESYQWIAGLGIYVSLFVLYQNKLQFSGWYKGEGRKKLSKAATTILLSCSIIMLAIPFVLGIQ